MTKQERVSDDILIRLRRAYDETGNALLSDAIDAIAQARRAPSAQREAVKWVCDLMDEADGALDKDTYDQMRELNEPPDDAEVWIRVGTRRKINVLFNAIAELRRALSQGEKP